MKKFALNFYLYIILYIYIFILFLKGYYPANETGILFIGFLIFMTLAYTFVGSMISDELDAKRREVYEKFETLLDQQYQTLQLLRTVHQNIANYKNNFRNGVNIFVENIESELNSKAEQDSADLINHSSTQLLATVLREELSIAKEYTNSSYVLAIDELLNNKTELESEQ